MNVFSLKLCWKTSTRVLSTSLPRYIARCPVMLRKEDVAAMRQDYKSPVFDEGCLVAKEPFMQFDSWFKEAMKVQGEGEVNAMILATCGRLVLLLRMKHEHAIDNRTQRRIKPELT